MHSPKVMIIGEAPGADEDASGLPFCGRFGRLVDHALAKAGFSATDCYICNVVKCRPPRNRDPLPEEKDACRKYLNAQMKLVEPEVIISLGRHAFLSLVPDCPIKISKENGKQFEYGLGDETIPLFALWHPAYVLRNAPLLEEFEGNFERVWHFLNPIPVESEDGEPSNS